MCNGLMLQEEDIKKEAIEFVKNKENIDKIDSHINIKYTREQLEDLIKDHEIV